MKAKRIGRKPNEGKKLSQEWIENMRKTRFGNPSNTEKIAINNGIKGTFICKDQPIPEGWIKGRIKFSTLGRKKKCNINNNN